MHLNKVVSKERVNILCVFIHKCPPSVKVPQGWYQPQRNKSPVDDRWPSVATKQLLSIDFRNFLSEQ